MHEQNDITFERKPYDIILSIAWMVVYYILYLCTYYSVCLRLGLHWDEVLDLHGGATDTYCAAGRWSLWSFRLLFGEGAAMLQAGLTAGAFISMAIVVQVHAFQLKSAWLRLTYGLLMMASYQWAFALQYSHQSDAVALGILLCTVSAWYTYKGGTACSIIAASCLSIGIGAYQSLALYFAIMWFALILQDKRFPQQTGFWHPVMRAAGIALSSLIVWWSVKQLTIRHIPESTLAWVQAYQRDLTSWPGMFTCGSFREAISTFWHYTRLTLSNASGLGKSSDWIFTTLLLPLGGLALHFIRSPHTPQRNIKLVLLLLIWWLPFSLPLLLLSPAMTLRSWLAVPLSFAVIWIFWLSSLRVNRVCCWTITALAAGLMFTTAVKVYLDAQHAAICHDNTLKTLRAMHSTAMQHSAASHLDCPSILVFGKLEPETHPNYIWQAFNSPHIMGWYCKGYGMAPMRRATSQENEIYSDTLNSMGSWPADSSIRQVGNHILIKLGENMPK